MGRTTLPVAGVGRGLSAGSSATNADPTTRLRRPLGIRRAAAAARAIQLAACRRESDWSVFSLGVEWWLPIRAEDGGINRDHLEGESAEAIHPIQSRLYDIADQGGAQSRS